MGRIWSDQNKFDKWLRVELAVCEAWAERGAKAVIGWDGDVSSTHTDAATDQPLDLLVTEGLTAEDAVSRAAAMVGADPFFGG